MRRRVPMKWRSWTRPLMAGFGRGGRGIHPTELLREIDRMARSVEARRQRGVTLVPGYEELLNPRGIGLSSYNEAIRRRRRGGPGEDQGYEELLPPMRPLWRSSSRDI